MRKKGKEKEYLLASWMFSFSPDRRRQKRKEYKLCPFTVIVGVCKCVSKWELPENLEETLSKQERNSEREMAISDTDSDKPKIDYLLYSAFPSLPEKSCYSSPMFVLPSLFFIISFSLPLSFLSFNVFPPLLLFSLFQSECFYRT